MDADGKFKQVGQIGILCQVIGTADCDSGPDRSTVAVLIGILQPMPKEKPAMIANHMTGLRTDDEFYDYLQENKASAVRDPTAHLSPARCASFG